MEQVARSYLRIPQVLALGTQSQLISCPSSIRHFAVRKIPEDLLETASHSCGDTPYPFSQPQPVFLGLKERRRERLDPTIPESSSETSEIDLDEDGPLRRVIRDASFCDTSDKTAGAPFGLESWLWRSWAMGIFAHAVGDGGEGPSDASKWRGYKAF